MSTRAQIAKLGIVASDWKVVPLASLCEEPQNGFYREGMNCDKGYRMVHMHDLFAHRFIADQEMRRVAMTENEVARFSLKEGDILFGRRSLALEGVGKAAVVGSLKDTVTFESSILRLQPQRGQLNSSFALAFLESHVGRKQMLSFARQATISGISGSDLKVYLIPNPPLPEQRKIAEILSTWDEALTQLDALIETQERRKKALMQQLLTGKKRFPGFKGKWKKVGLGDVAENVADANKGRMGTTSLYGVTKADGVVPMRDHVKGESFDRCKRVETDWFAYNPMRINIGSIARWQGADTVMVSGDYVVFRCHTHKLLPAYLDHLRQSWMWQSFVTRGGNGSVRIRIYFSDLAEFTFPCPPLEEQRQIATFLDTADQQLTLLRTQRTALDQQKRGLMQRLLTGKIRVTPKSI